MCVWYHYSGWIAYAYAKILILFGGECVRHGFIRKTYSQFNRTRIILLLPLLLLLQTISAVSCAFYVPIQLTHSDFQSHCTLALLQMCSELFAKNFPELNFHKRLLVVVGNRNNTDASCIHILSVAAKCLSFIIIEQKIQWNNHTCTVHTAHTHTKICSMRQ